MERNANKVIKVDFGGTGPRQALGAALMEVDLIKSALVLTIDEEGNVFIYSSEVTEQELSLIAMKFQGYALGSINGWLEEE
jgi:hypothetical protein